MNQKSWWKQKTEDWTCEVFHCLCIGTFNFLLKYRERDLHGAWLTASRSVHRIATQLEKHTTTCRRLSSLLLSSGSCIHRWTREGHWSSSASGPASVKSRSAAPSASSTRELRFELVPNKETPRLSRLLSPPLPSKRNAWTRCDAKIQFLWVIDEVKTSVIPAYWIKSLLQICRLDCVLAPACFFFFQAVWLTQTNCVVFDRSLCFTACIRVAFS